MKKGFIFDRNRCVDCRACSAACVLENGWSFKPRTIYKSEQYAGDSVAVMNLSLACNHCGNPACLRGCPAGAYTTDEVTGAVLVNDKKCFGCNYCIWNCPYDAPKIDPAAGLIGKCNLCLSSLKPGLLPACSSACPTGALKYNTLSDTGDASFPEWFPGKDLDANIRFPGSNEIQTLRIVPFERFDSKESGKPETERGISGEWSLIAFTLLAALSVGLMASSFLTANFSQIILSVALAVSGGLLSIFHLKKKLRAWRALVNISRSPLSREIALYILYILLSLGALISINAGLILAASLSGLFLLFAIDLVYTATDSRLSFVFHSGQTFLTGLLIASFFAGLKFPFIFIALIKIISAILNISSRERAPQTGLRIFRTALLLITGISIATGISFTDPAITFIFVTGEVIDRIMFYLDFKPLSITSFFTGKIE
jgi:Fe-S-cluster-containing dehydrogenase component/DMSO reductase anchor subunit